MSIFLVKDIRADDYFTINKDDHLEFLNLEGFFQKLPSYEDFNFKIIYDNKETKEVLKQKFLSKGRGGEYDETLTSVSKITGSLFPVNIAKDKGLLRWKNNTSIKEQKKTKEKSSISMEYGTDVHLLLENTHNDKRHFSVKKFKDYEADSKYPEICKKILDYPNHVRGDNCEGSFKNNELRSIDCVASELFLKDYNLGIQGTIDLIGFYKNQFYLMDYKTTSKISKTKNKKQDALLEKPMFKAPGDMTDYMRQLCLYNMILKNKNMYDKNLVDNMNFKIYMFHLIWERYRVYEFSREEILQWEEPVLRVLNWFKESLK